MGVSVKKQAHQAETLILASPWKDSRHLLAAALQREGGGDYRETH